MSHIMYDDHLHSAMRKAVEAQRKAERKMNYTMPSCILAVFEETLEALENGKHIEVRHRKGWSVNG